MIRIERLKKSYGLKLLFQDASYHFPPGERIALVGANGAGKTTLLNILCGIEEADDGEVLIPGDISLGYLPQKPNPTPEATIALECEAGAAKIALLKVRLAQLVEQMSHSTSDKLLAEYEATETAFRQAGGYALRARATTILAGLGFRSSQFEQSPLVLSGGWRMRLELARLFMRNPDFLILDEPTNHLDLPSLVWVENYLSSLPCTLLFVSHDRALLNRLASLTLHLSQGKLTPYRGNFDAFLELRAQRQEQEEAARGQLQRRREAMEQFVERFGAKASKASQAQARVKMIARIRALEDELPEDGEDSSVMISIPEPRPAPRMLLELNAAAIGYDRPLATNVTLNVEKGSKIAIIGANGIGKSTLLRSLAGRLPFISGSMQLGHGVQISYFAQEQSETLDSDKSVLENLLRNSHLSEKEARGLLGSFLFRGDDVYKLLRVLSGGEASRLGLAVALAAKASLLLLDEPTNHLDMSSVDSLSASLADWSGTAVFVSHDRKFIDDVCTHVFAMVADGRSMLFPGKLKDYENLAAIQGFPNVLAVESAATKLQTSFEGPTPAAPRSERTLAVSEEQIRDLKRRRQKLSQQIAKADQGMHGEKSKIESLDQDILASSHDHQLVRQLADERSRVAGRLEVLEMQWLEWSEDLQTVEQQLKDLGRS